MLNELSISNFALIDEITINFDEGLNIFTGTTGVGKSLIIGALNFLLGSRTTNDIARSKTKDVSVSGLFFIKNSQIRQSIKGHIDKIDDEEIIIQRSLDQKGRNRCKLNNQPITVSLLKEIGELLVNIHGQHEHESLTNPQQQLRTLDSFGKLDDLRSEYSTIYNNALEKEKRLHSLNDQHSERKKQLELYRYEIDEIERCQLQPEEDKSLEEERYILANSEKIQNVLSLCSNSLYESDNSIIDGLKDITNELSKIMGIDKGFENTLEVCNQTIYQLEDIEPMGWALGLPLLYLDVFYDFSGNNESLDFASTFAYFKDFCISEKALHAIVSNISISSKNLNCFSGDFHGSFTGKKFCHGRLFSNI
mgnify:CR=1 FL=1